MFILSYTIQYIGDCHNPLYRVNPINKPADHITVGDLSYVSMLNSFVFLVYMYRIFKAVGVALAARGSIKSWAPDKT